MNIALWVIQILAALAFIGIGIVKVTQPLDRLGKMMSWVRHYSPAFVRFIGAAELLGGIGLIVPVLTVILPWLTPMAALGLAIIMVGGVIYHFQHNEANQVAAPLVLLVLMIVVVLGRFVVQPIS